MMSSTRLGSSDGTLSSAARMMVAARSSGRTLVSDPLWARPMGLRAVETMTASGMDGSLQRGTSAHADAVDPNGPLRGPVYRTGLTRRQPSAVRDRASDPDGRAVGGGVG